MPYSLRKWSLHYDSLSSELKRPKERRKNDRRSVDREIKHFNVQLTSMLKSISNPFLVVDKQLNLIYLNQMAKELLYQGEDLSFYGGKLSDLILPDSGLYHKICQAVLRQEPQGFEVLFKAEKYLEVDVFPFQSGLTIYLRDITERKLFEAKKNQTNQEIANILERISYGFYALDQEWKFTYINKEAEKFFVPESVDLVNKKIWIEYPEFIGSELEERFKTCFREQRALNIETRGILKDRWYESHIFPSSNGLSIFVRDITERKHLESEMARLDRLNCLGEMVACIGHELRNPMTAVRGFLQLLGEKEECFLYKDLFDLMTAELDKCNEVITKLLSLAKNRVLNLEVSNLNDIISANAPLIRAEAAAGKNVIAFELNPISDLILDQNEIRQLILNLIHNALDAMEMGAELFVRTYQDCCDVILEIEDQGAGIDSSVIDQIGTPFVTTKENRIGLGLAVCYSIAARHNAVITFETSNQGTTFFVRFCPDIL